MMRLFYAPTSPYVKKVLAVAIEAGVEDRIELVSHDTTSEDPDLRRLNPLQRIPTLECEDGRVVFDSPVICEYLDHLGNADLFPPTGDSRWRALVDQALGDGIVDACQIWRKELQRPFSMRMDTILARQQRAVVCALESLELVCRNWHRERADIGTLAVGTALDYLDLRFPQFCWRDHHPLLASWYEAFSGRASMTGTRLRTAEDGPGTFVLYQQRGRHVE
ncbi:MAG: glutathione S-transferase [Spiribacter salinus]|uniref:Glutathione S-transferase n=1 Tax=Spiribacter salinus TaxID=1335746 RepID=A0A540VRD5_9GAMM|nr:MAG: glutathione S-transferase [Spiribacter salinus]